MLRIVGRDSRTSAITCVEAKLTSSCGIEAFFLELQHLVNESFSFFADYVGLRHADVFEKHLSIRGGCCNYRVTLDQLAQSMVSCGPVEVFAVAKVAYILTTSPCFDDLEFDIFVAGGPQCHFTTSVAIVVRI